MLTAVAYCDLYSCLQRARTRGSAAISHASMCLTAFSAAACIVKHSTTLTYNKRRRDKSSAVVFNMTLPKYTVTTSYYSVTLSTYTSEACYVICKDERVLLAT
jgi:hypothetical protein